MAHTYEKGIDMIIEVAVIDVLAGRSDEFAREHGKVRTELEKDGRIENITLLHCHENPDRFITNTWWASLEAHQDFLDSGAGKIWAQVGQLLAGKPETAHYVPVGS